MAITGLYLLSYILLLLLLLSYHTGQLLRNDNQKDAVWPASSRLPSTNAAEMAATATRNNRGQQRRQDRQVPAMEPRIVRVIADPSLSPPPPLSLSVSPSSLPLFLYECRRRLVVDDIRNSILLTVLTGNSAGWPWDVSYSYFLFSFY